MKQLLTACLALTLFSAPAQTLFTYGNTPVAASEFLTAFKKNKVGASNTGAIKEYLDLYIASRLKVAEAREARFDTLPQLVSDLANLRQQILPNYLNDKEAVNSLVKEAFTRGQKDIHTAHIFIAFTKNGVTDTTAANKRLVEATGLLKKGVKFEDVAAQYSDDPAAKTNGGDLGWLTVFGLPYSLENLLYATAAGQVSVPFASKTGYHLLRNIGERKAVGRLRMAQILMAFPPGADEATKSQIKKRADSIYARLQAGDDFGRMAILFSNDVISAASKGQIQDFGAGEYEPAFETIAFGLPKDGAISKPFLTTHGLHILQRIKAVPVSATLDVATTETIRNKVEQSDRILTTKTAMAQKVLKKAGYKQQYPQLAFLWGYTDSVLTYKSPKTILPPSAALFMMGDKTTVVSDWITYAQTNLANADGSAKPYPQLWDAFVQATALNYYSDHLEDFNEEFSRQLSEFADGNLFFEIMQRKVWTPAQTDTQALAIYYQRHRNKYVWEKSADAVFFYAADEASAKQFYEALKATPANWIEVAATYAEKITADSARFEVAQIPNGSGAQLRPRLLTTPVVNKSDNTASLAYIVRLYLTPEPRGFNEAKGLVITDYQEALEKEWIAGLKKKYPVTVNENVLNEVVKKMNQN